MSESTSGQKVASLFGILGAFLVVGLLVMVMMTLIPAPVLNKDRALERKTALAEMRDADAKALKNYEVIDPAKRTARLAIERAMELTIEEYKNPEAARTNLIARAEKANEPPPKAPEQPSKYE